jgi:hypothetical protein
MLNYRGIYYGKNLNTKSITCEVFTMKKLINLLPLMVILILTFTNLSKPIKAIAIIITMSFYIYSIRNNTNSN